MTTTGMSISTWPTDYGRNNLYRNDGGRFVDVAEGAGVEDTAAGMSVSWADVNRDGRMDVYIGNMFSAAGGRIAFQRKFHSAAEAVTRAQIQRHARGNTLFVNRGGGAFEDVSLDRRGHHGPLGLGVGVR